MATFPWNGWQLSSGISGNFALEYAHIEMSIKLGELQDIISDAKGVVPFGDGRGDLSFGSCDVSIPHGHRIGDLERPSWLRLKIENKDKHVVLLKTTPMEENKFYAEMSERVNQTEERRALIFFHEFNVPFKDAALRTAQIAFDLDFHGAPLFYSWPSLGKVTATSYTSDEQAIQRAQRYINQFLEDFFRRSDAKSIFLIAHSMGNRALTAAIIELLRVNPEYRERIQEIILTAPDIDRDVFISDIAPPMVEHGASMTLYASSADKALALSKKVHRYSRAGDTNDGVVVIDGIETVDATSVDTSFLGHSYYAGERTVLSDIYYLVNSGHRASDRYGLKLISRTSGNYWEFMP